MLADEDWVSPQMDGTLFLNKPPLMFWLAASAIGLGAMDERVRLASIGDVGAGRVPDGPAGHASLRRPHGSARRRRAGHHVRIRHRVTDAASRLRAGDDRGGRAAVLADRDGPARGEACSMVRGCRLRARHRLHGEGRGARRDRGAADRRVHHPRPGLAGVAPAPTVAVAGSVPGAGRAVACAGRLAARGVRLGLRREPAHHVLSREEAAARLGRVFAAGVLARLPRSQPAVGRADAVHGDGGVARVAGRRAGGGSGERPVLALGGGRDAPVLPLTVETRALLAPRVAGGRAAGSTRLVAHRRWDRVARGVGLARGFRGRSPGRGRARRRVGHHVGDELLLAAAIAGAPRSRPPGRGDPTRRRGIARPGGANAARRRRADRPGGPRGADDGDPDVRPGGGGASILLATVGARDRGAYPADDGDRVRGAAGVPAGGWPRLLHRPPHHLARAGERLHPAGLSRPLP